MPPVSISAIADRSCVTFSLQGVETADSRRNPKIYDVFVEFGDGNYLSFYTKNVENELVTYNFDFVHNYPASGNYPIHGNMRSVYGDDGDPKYPTSTVEIPQHTANCDDPFQVENKLPTPAIGGIWLGRSHMPMFGQRNVYVINYDNVTLSPDDRNFILLFYNQKHKQAGGLPYTQWDTINDPAALAAAETCRMQPSLLPRDADTTDNLRTSLDIQNADEYLDEYSHYIAFEIVDVPHDGPKNLFVTLQGHADLERAVASEEEQTLSMVTAHFAEAQTTIQNSPSNNPVNILKPGGALRLLDKYEIPNERLTMFHDPNFITVKPKQVKREDERFTMWEYEVKFSNDGEAGADYLRVNCFIDTAYFDLDSLQVLDAVFFEKLKIKKADDRVIFEWENVALAGKNSPVANLLTDEYIGFVKFEISPKAALQPRKKIVAFADIIMGFGDIRETTRTPNLAVTHIRDIQPSNARVPAPVNYKPYIWALLLLSVLIILLLLGIILFCCY